MCMSPRAATTLTLAALVGLGCEEEITDPTDTPLPTLENVWPAADGTAWSYTTKTRVWTDGFVPVRTYDAPEDVPPAPPIEAVDDLLASHAIGEGPVETTPGTYRLTLDGDTTTLSGAEGQNLAAITFFDTEGAVTARAGAASVLLSRLAAARPDLRERIRARAPAIDLRTGLPQPLFLHGGAWESTAAHIGTFGDLDRNLAWKFLEDDLTTGHAFTHALVPSLADDVFLHARVARRHTVETAVGRLKNAVEVHYLVDYGVARIEDGEMPVYIRTFDYGFVTYAPGVGPVASYERRFVETGDPPGPGTSDLDLRSLGASVTSDVPFTGRVRGLVTLTGTLRNAKGRRLGTETIVQAGIPVFLDRNRRRFAEAVTDANGAFAFDGLDPASYHAVSTLLPELPASTEEIVVSGEAREFRIPITLGTDGTLRVVPNPFFGSTVQLGYTVKTAGPVTLGVHDVFMNPITTLVDAQHAAGEFAVSWNAGGRPDGPYWAVLSRPSGNEAALVFKE